MGYSIVRSSLRPSRLAHHTDSSSDLTDHSQVLHFTGDEEWLLRGHDLTRIKLKRGHIFSSEGFTAFRLAMRFGLPDSVALLFQDFGFLYDWDPARQQGTRHRAIVTVNEIDSNRQRFERRQWTELEILMAKAFTWRCEKPFTASFPELESNPGYAIYREHRTTPYAEYEKTIEAIIVLMKEGRAKPADVALVLKWAPMFAEYADKAGVFATRSFEKTVDMAAGLVEKLNREAVLAGRPSSMNLATLDVPAFLNTIGTAKSFELDEALIRYLKQDPALRDVLADLHIPRLNRTLRVLGRTFWRKFIRTQTLWNGLHLDVFRGQTPAESITAMKREYEGHPQRDKSPFFHAAIFSSRLATSETYALLFNPFFGKASGERKRRRYSRPTKITLWLLGELLKALMRSKVREAAFGEDSPEALAYQFNNRKPVDDAAGAFAQIIIDSPLPWGDALMSDLVGLIKPEILFEAVEQCFIHPKNEVWDERERQSIFGRTAQLLGKVALVGPENGHRVAELLSKLRHALPDETLLSPQKRRIIQHRVKETLVRLALPENLTQVQLVDVLTEHWMDLDARKQALIDLNVDEKLAGYLASIGIETPRGKSKPAGAGFVTGSEVSRTASPPE